VKRDGRLSIKVADQTIEGTLLAPEKLIPGILFIHGWGGSQEQDLKKAEEIAELGCLCFTFDLRGHAATEPQRNVVTRADALADVLGAYDFLASQEMVDRSAIAVVGTSYGGYLATLLTELRPVNWLALRVPALYPDSDWSVPKALLNRQKIRSYRRFFRGASRNRSLRACSRFIGDVLIVESEHDELVPHPAIGSFIAAFRQANSLSYRVIKGADHALRDETCRKAYHDLLLAWIGEMVRGARRSAPSISAT
jgi:pimeloyl-ACP methyl ester carboxylesterase